MNPTASNYNYQAPSTGGGDIKGFNPNFTDTFNQQNKNSQNFYGGQNNQVNAFQGAYQAATNALPSYQSLNAQNNAQYNVQPLMQNATNLNNEVLRLPSENYGMTQGSDTNQGQLDQMTGVQQFRLQPLAQNATAQAQQAQTLSNQATGYGIQNNQFQTQPFQTAAPMVTNMLASQASGFNQQQSDELQALTAKMQSGVTLTNAEQDRINQLKIAEEGYQNAVQTANISATNALQRQQLANQYQNVAAGNTLVNTANGNKYTAG